ncbi:MAG: hypothetical protein PXY39_05900 [archaeon]|nr:hypothetical protein [archaeon]
MKVFRFRNIDDGSVMVVEANNFEEALKKVEADYSDPIHAWQDWASMDNDNDED